MATKCHICGKPVDPKDRIRDHCHVTGEFCGLVHSSMCSANYCCLKESTSMVPVLFQNLRGYDSQFLMVMQSESLLCKGF